MIQTGVHSCLVTVGGSPQAPAEAASCAPVLLSVGMERVGEGTLSSQSLQHLVGLDTQKQCSSLRVSFTQFQNIRHGEDAYFRGRKTRFHSPSHPRLQAELGINSLSSSGEQNAWGGGWRRTQSECSAAPTRCPLSAEDGGHGVCASPWLGFKLAARPC